MISEEVRRFVRSSVKSVWALELLLLLRRDSERSWTAEALTNELRGSRQLVADILSHFIQIGLVVQSSQSYRYQPTDANLDRLVQDLDKTYAERRIAVIQEIVSAPNEKIQTLADAFKLKRE